MWSAPTMGGTPERPAGMSPRQATGPACGFQAGVVLAARPGKGKCFFKDLVRLNVLHIDDAGNGLDRPSRGRRDGPAPGNRQLTFPAPLQLQDQAQPPLAPAAAFHDLPQARDRAAVVQIDLEADARLGRGRLEPVQ